jgi:integrase
MESPRKMGKMVMGSGWQAVRREAKGPVVFWRRYLKVPVHLRDFLPGEHRGKATLTLSAKTSNKAEAKKIDAREGFGTTLQGWLDAAEAAYQRDKQDRSNDWHRLNQEQELEDLTSDRGMDEALADHQRRVKKPRDPIAAAVQQQLETVLRGLGVDPSKLDPNRPKKRVPVMTIWEDWQKRNGTKDTKATYKMMLGKLIAFAGDDANQIKSEKIEEFRTAMETRGAADSTVHNYLTCFATIFNHGVSKQMIDESPLKKVVIGKKPEREVDPYATVHVIRIVHEGAAQPPQVRIPTLVAAYGGQRLAEVIDASTRDIILEEGVWCITIRMKYRAKGTRLKTRTSRRIVPLHPAIVTEVLAYRDWVVATYGEGSLFPQYNPDEQGRRAAAGGKKIGKWIRKGLKITAEEVSQPMHGFRHYVRTQLMLKKVDRKIRNMITGHSGSDESEKYEHPDIPAMVEALKLLPDPLKTE